MFSLDTITVSSIVAKENYKEKCVFHILLLVLAPSIMRYALYNFASWFKYNNLYKTKIKEYKPAKSEVDLSLFILL